MPTSEQFNIINEFLKDITNISGNDCSIDIKLTDEIEAFRVRISLYHFTSAYRDWESFEKYMDFIKEKLKSDNFFGLCKILNPSSIFRNNYTTGPDNTIRFI